MTAPQQAACARPNRPSASQPSPVASRAARAFTLIELALAIFVLGMAVLALYSLSRLGVRAATEAEDEMRAAMFADDVFTTLGIYADHCRRATNETTWVEFWRQVQDGTQPLPVAAWDYWQGPGDGATPLTVYGDGEVRTNVYRSVDLRADASFEAIPEYGVQYRLGVSLPPFNKEQPPAWTNSVRVTLHVWSGTYRRNPEPFTFYTHFADAGVLP